MPTSVRMNSNARMVRNAASACTTGVRPRRARPAAVPTMRLLAMPTSMKRGPSARGQAADGRAVLRGQDDDVIALAPPGARSVVLVGGRSSHRTTAAVGRRGRRGRAVQLREQRLDLRGREVAANQRSARASRLGTPLPRTVWAMIAVGRPGARGRRPKAASRAAKSWPSTCAQRPAEGLELARRAAPAGSAPRCARWPGSRCDRRSPPGCRG